MNNKKVQQTTYGLPIETFNAIDKLDIDNNANAELLAEKVSNLAKEWKVNSKDLLKYMAFCCDEYEA